MWLKPGLTLKARMDNGLWLVGCYFCAQDLCDMPSLWVAKDDKCTDTVNSILPASKVLFCRIFTVFYVHGKSNLLICKMCECHSVGILSKFLDWQIYLGVGTCRAVLVCACQAGTLQDLATRTASACHSCEAECQCNLLALVQWGCTQLHYTEGHWAVMWYFPESAPSGPLSVLSWCAPQWKFSVLSFSLLP